MTIRAQLPKPVMEELKSHLLGACDLVVEGFSSAKGREDSVTGSLGERLRLREKLIAVPNEGTWRLSISWNKFRSAKGRSGEEREIGADGIIQFELLRDYGEEIYTKGLLFQAKMEDDSDIQRLNGQCQNMEELSKNCSAVFQYGPESFKAMDSQQVLNDGREVRQTMPNFHTEGKPLGRYLVERFIDCHVGSEKLFYEHDSESLIVPERNSAYQRIRTKLNKISIKAYAPSPRRGLRP